MARLAGLRPIVGRLLGSGHLLSVSLVAASCAVGQAALLTRRPLIFQLPDSSSYITLGARLANQPNLGNLFDAYRTPGYPVFLALIGAVQGGVPGTWVVYAQAGLMVVTAFELYVLIFGLTSSRTAAAVGGILFGSNVRLLDWERLIMTESLAIFLVMTIVLAFWLWMLHRSASWAVVFGVASILAVLTRPSLVYLPVCLLAVVLVSDRRRWLPVLMVAASIYLPVLGYGVINDRLHPHAGLSAVGNINLLGKVLEYGMQNGGDAARFPALWQGITSLPSGDHDPYDILKGNPAAMGTNYADASAFSRAIIERHPLEYLIKSAGDFFAGWLAVPYAYIPGGAYQWVAQGLATYALAAYATYPALPLAIIALIVLWPRLERQVALGIAGLFLVVAGSLGTTAVFSYVDFARLRTPVDAVALASVIAVLSLVMRRLPGAVQDLSAHAWWTLSRDRARGRPSSNRGTDWLG